MKIAVFMKQVPDMQTVKFDTVNRKIDRSSAAAEVNPYDLNALEAALEISEKTGAEVIAVTMGPGSGKEVLIDAIARGAGSGVLLSDRGFGGADTNATAMTLKAAVEKIGGCDLLICGEKTVDGDTGQVGAELAEFLGLPHISYVEKIKEVSDAQITVETNILDALYEVKASYPVLLTVTKDVNIPRLPSIKGKMKAKKAEIPIWTLEELSRYIAEEEVGVKGSPTRVHKIEVTPHIYRQSKIVSRKEEIGSFVESMFEELREKRVI